MSWTNVDVPFIGGLNLTSSEYVAPSAELIDFENIVVDKQSVLTARQGYSRISDNVYPNAELLELNESPLVYLNGEIQNSFNTKLGNFVPLKAEKVFVSSNTFNESNVRAHTDTFTVSMFVRRPENKLYYTVLSRDGLSVIPITQISDALVNPNSFTCFTIGNRAFLFFTTVTGTFVQVVDIPAKTIVDSVTLDTPAISVYIQPDYDNELLVLCIVKFVAGVPQSVFSCLDFDGNPLGSSPYLTAASVSLANRITHSFNIDTTFTSIAAVTQQGTVAAITRIGSFGTVSVNFLINAATISLRQAAVCFVEKNSVLYIEGFLAKSSTKDLYSFAAPFNVTLSAQISYKHRYFNLPEQGALASHAISLAQKALCFLIMAGTTQSTFILVDGDFAPQGILEYGSASIANATQTQWLKASSSDIYSLGLCRAASLIIEDGQFQQANQNAVCYNITLLDSVVSKQVDDVLYLPSLMLYNVDAQKAYEHNFVYYPEPSVTEDEGVSPFIAGNNFVYYLVYEAFDFKGKRTLSAAFPVRHTVSETGANVIFSIPTMQFTQHASVNIVVYRTENNGEIAYRVSSSDPDINAVANGYIFNDVTTDVVQFEDALSDEELVTREPFYGNSELLNYPVERCTAVHLNKNRLWVNSDDKLLFSKILNSSSLPEFTGSFIAFDSSIRALASSKDSLLVFADDLWTISGDGPTNSKDSLAFFSDPIRLADRISTFNNNTVLSVPNGVLFCDKNNVYLSGGLGQIQHVGFLEDFEVPKRVVYDLKNELAVFLTNSRFLVFSDTLKWGTFSVFARDISKSGLHILNINNEISRQTTNHNDEGVAYNMKVRTGWIKTSLSGFNRIKRFAVFGKFLAGHQVRVTVYYNNNDNAAYTFTVNPASQASVQNLYFLEHVLKTMKCSALSIKLEILPLTSNSNAVELHYISFQAQQLFGLHRAQKLSMI